MMIIMVEQYHDIEAALQDADSQYSASGCQGVICGILVFGDPSPLLRWIDEDLEEPDTTHMTSTTLRHLLMQLSEITQRCLEDPGISFGLLLPEDDQIPLKRRVEALSDWCEGFVYGLTLAGLSNKTCLSRDSSEFINDVMEISRAFVDSGADEADEAAYCELVEYLRVAVLLLAEELRSLGSRNHV